jgi:hypothetical protein
MQLAPEGGDVTRGEHSLRTGAAERAAPSGRLDGEIHLVTAFGVRGGDLGEDAVHLGNGRPVLIDRLVVLRDSVGAWRSPPGP